jgi:hypothetical protein
MICHADCRNQDVKPSDPGALSSGSAQITFHTSYSVKREVRWLWFRCGKSRHSRLIELDLAAGMPMTASKKLKAASALLSIDNRVWLSCSGE